MSQGPYGRCRYCGSMIGRPITEPFFCNDGCMAAWDVEEARVRLEAAVHAPKVPEPGYPMLGTEGAKQGRGGWGGTTHTRRRA